MKSYLFILGCNLLIPCHLRPLLFNLRLFIRQMVQQFKLLSVNPLLLIRVIPLKLPPSSPSNLITVVVNLQHLNVQNLRNWKIDL